MLYPLITEPIYKERVWGGDALNQVFGRQLPGSFIGESWDVACHEHGMSIIENGELAGKSLLEIMELYKEEFLGSELKDIEKFPLLVKLLDARETLSVQVHPQDQYAKQHENGELGKSEMWYVMDAKPGAKLVIGIEPEVTCEQFRQAIEKEQVEDLLKEMPVEKGDLVYIPAGLVHAIGEGILIAEIQQNSDTVYRVYDWKRVGLDGKPRELHVEKALDVIDFEGKLCKEKVKGLTFQKEDARYTYYIASSHFAVEKIQLQGNVTETANGFKFYLYTCVEGDCIIEHMSQEYAVEAGRSFIIPASIGGYTLKGQCTLLKSYVPNIEKDFYNPLVQKGYTMEQIRANTAVES